jgi:hypothetical protein
MQIRILVLPALVLMAVPALAQQHSARASAPRERHAAPPPPPRSIGKFEEWTAATHQEAGQTVCYAFTRATASTPALPGRGDVVLTVTQRPGGVRDAVAISAGFAYAPNAEVAVQVDQANLSFYTAQRSAFARNGHATVLAFAHGRQAVAKSPGPRDTVMTDTFSLRGFSPAFAAVNRACSVKG